MILRCALRVDQRLQMHAELVDGLDGDAVRDDVLKRLRRQVEDGTLRGEELRSVEATGAVRARIASPVVVAAAAAAHAFVKKAESVRGEGRAGMLVAVGSGSRTRESGRGRGRRR